METQKEKTETQKNVAKIKVIKNDPYLVSGKIPFQKHMIIADSEETATEWQQSTKYSPQEKYDLYRCDHSKNKPFCDSSNYPEAETVEKEHYLLNACTFLSRHYESNVDDGAVLHDLVVFHFCGATFYMDTLDVFDCPSCFVNSVLGCFLPAFF
jgi:CDGSH-type Zn-finger protein